MVLKGVQFCLPGDIWQYLETFLVVATGAGKGARSCHWYLVSGGQGWWKASWNPRDIAAYCNYLAPHANGVGVEKPSGQWEHEQVVANDQSLPLEESILWYSISVVVAMLYSYLTYFFFSLWIKTPFLPALINSMFSIHHLKCTNTMFPTQVIRLNASS